jgi:hypothetical protein
MLLRVDFRGESEMKPGALILFVTIAIASPVRAQNCTPHFTSANPCKNENDFVSKICNMAAFDTKDFNPLTTTDANYHSPKCDQVNTSIANIGIMKDAYKLAPDNVKSALCQLTRVFVTTDHTYTNPSDRREALGIWESHGRGDGGVYIAIPDQLLSSASSLADEENNVLGRLLLPQSSSPYPSGHSLPMFANVGSASATPAAAVLAVLAHELGHVLLSDTHADGTGGEGHNHPRQCHNLPKDKCFESAFLGRPGENRGWDKVVFHQRMRRWTDFANHNGNIYQNPAFRFSNVVSDLTSTPTHPSNDADATRDMYAIYHGRSFTSLFATVSPEEDFVETYKYAALAAAADPAGNKLGLDITFPAGVEHVIDAVRTPSAELGEKIRCVNSLASP